MANYGHYRISRKAHLSKDEGGDPFWNEPRTFSRWEAWQDLIQLAAWADHERMVSGQLVSVARGEVCASIRFLAGRWSWSLSKVHRFLELLQDMERIAKADRDASRNSYVIVNYDTYQASPNERGTPTERSRNGRGTVAEQREVRRSKEKKVEEGEETSTSSCAEPDEPAPAPVLDFPVTGNGEPSWFLTEAKVREYEETYPGTKRDAILQELRAARQWCRDNPTKRKTPRGMPHFLSSWLARAQNKGGIGTSLPFASKGPRTTTGGRWEYGDPGADFEENPS